MKKIFFLISSMFLLTGCSAQYDLVYENGVLTESLKVISSKNDIIDGEKFEDLVNNYYSNTNLLVDYTVQPGDASEEEVVSKYEVYNKQIINENDKYGINLFYKYDNKSDISNSYIINNLYKNVTIVEKYIQVHTIKDIFSNYPNLDNIIINIKSDKNIDCIDGEQIEDNVCSWNINKYNYLNNKNLKINIKNNEIENFLTVNNGQNMMYVILAIFIVVILISILIIYEKVRKSNK